MSSIASAAGPRTGTAGSLRDARSKLEEASELLLRASPAGLDRCEILLAGAMRILQQRRDDWRERERGGTALGEAVLLRKALKRTARLLKGAASFYAGVQRIGTGADGGYRADGSPGAVRFARRILAEG